MIWSLFYQEVAAHMVVFEFMFSEEMILEMFRQERRSRKFARFATPLRWIAYMLLAMMITGGLLVGYFENAGGTDDGSVAWGPYAYAAVMAFLLVLFLFSRRIDECLLIRRCRKSPYIDDRITTRISDEGLSSRGTGSSVELHWALFTEARLLMDCILLFEGPRMFRYLPFDAIKRGTAAEAEELVRSHVKNCKVMRG